MKRGFDFITNKQWWNESELSIRGCTFALDPNLAPERALDHAKMLLGHYERPVLDPGVDEALQAYIARREEEIPAADALNNEH